MTQLWLHIGSGKTGTTALQAYLSDVAGAGTFPEATYPNIGLSTGHHIIGLSTGHHIIGISTGHHILARTFASDPDIAAQLEAEVAKGFPNIIVSSEVLIRRNPEEFLAIEEMFDEINVIVHLRRQDLYFESLYKEAVKAGQTTHSFDQYFHAVKRFGSYGSTLSGWLDSFPNARFHIVNYGEVRHKIDTVENFKGITGNYVPWPADFKSSRAKQFNPTPCKEITLLSRAIKKCDPDFDVLQFTLETIAEYPQYKRTNDLLALAKRQDILEYYRKENELLFKLARAHSAVEFEPFDEHDMPNDYPPFNMEELVNRIS